MKNKSLFIILVFLFTSVPVISFSEGGKPEKTKTQHVRCSTTLGAIPLNKIMLHNSCEIGK